MFNKVGRCTDNTHVFEAHKSSWISHFTGGNAARVQRQIHPQHHGTPFPKPTLKGNIYLFSGIRILRSFSLPGKLKARASRFPSEEKPPIHQIPLLGAMSLSIFLII